MRDFAKRFYASRGWKKTREAYLKSVGGLCERCKKDGIIRPAVIVHHKVYIDEKNINDPKVTLCWDNLEALCHEHHDQEHYTGNKRYKVDEDGRVIIRRPSLS